MPFSSSYRTDKSLLLLVLKLVMISDLEPNLKLSWPFTLRSGTKLDYLVLLVCHVPLLPYACLPSFILKVLEDKLKTTWPFFTLSVLLVYSCLLSTSGKLKISSPDNTFLLTILMLPLLLLIASDLELGVTFLTSGTNTQISHLSLINFGGH